MPMVFFGDNPNYDPSLSIIEAFCQWCGSENCTEIGDHYLLHNLHCYLCLETIEHKHEACRYVGFVVCEGACQQIVEDEVIVTGRLVKGELWVTPWSRPRRRTPGELRCRIRHLRRFDIDNR
jgi:hypothetical protein